jgi:hypothetical protein
MLTVGVDSGVEVGQGLGVEVGAAGVTGGEQATSPKASPKMTIKVLRIAKTFSRTFQTGADPDYFSPVTSYTITGSVLPFTRSGA